MVDEDLTYGLLFREAVSLARKTGTWVFERIRSTDDLEHVLGYLYGRVDDFENRKLRCNGCASSSLSARIGAWRRAIRFSMRLRGQDHKAIATRILGDIARDPEYSALVFIATTDIATCEGRTWKNSAKPCRKPGRPRVHHVRQADLRACIHCAGAGFVPKSRRQYAQSKG